MFFLDDLLTDPDPGRIPLHLGWEDVEFACVVAFVASLVVSCRVRMHILEPCRKTTKLSMPEQWRKSDKTLTLTPNKSLKVRLNGAGFVCLKTADHPSNIRPRHGTGGRSPQRQN